jgi:tetratricopeptide (TPR) repeat protein
MTALLLRLDPRYVEARVRLASLLRQRGRAQDALSQYEEALGIDPRLPEALFGSAMVLVGLGRYADARNRLEDAWQVHPGEATFVLALARLLAAAPDAGVRDGRRALTLVQALSDEDRRLDLGETMAMALAESGEYEEAAAWQRRAMAAAREAGEPDLAKRMAANLSLYEAGRPSRTPWRAEDLP